MSEQNLTGFFKASYLEVEYFSSSILNEGRDHFKLSKNAEKLGFCPLSPLHPEAKISYERIKTEDYGKIKFKVKVFLFLMVILNVNAKQKNLL